MVKIFTAALQKDEGGTEVADAPDPTPDTAEVEAKTKEALDKGMAFAQELEHSVFEHASEPDKRGRKTAGPKYK